MVSRAGNALTATECCAAGCLSRRESLDFFILVSFPKLTLLMPLSSYSGRASETIMVFVIDCIRSELRQCLFLLTYSLFIK